MTATGTWTEAAAARARALWDEGTSAEAIARALHCSKHAVLGYAHRNGFPPRASPIGRVGPKPAASSLKHALAGAASHRTPLPVVVPPAPQPPMAFRSCQWPEGEPGTKGFHFCGASPVVEGKPYCAAHHAIAYVRHPRMPAVPS